MNDQYISNFCAINLIAPCLDRFLGGSNSLALFWADLGFASKEETSWIYLLRRDLTTYCPSLVNHQNDDSYMTIWEDQKYESFLGMVHIVWPAYKVFFFPCSQDFRRGFSPQTDLLSMDLNDPNFYVVSEIHGLAYFRVRINTVHPPSKRQDPDKMTSNRYRRRQAVTPS